MSKIVVVTDSVATIPADLVKKHGIYVAPLHIIWDNQDYRDGIDMTPKEFYTRLRTAKNLPTTSSAIQGEYIQIFENLQGKCDGAVIVTISGDISSSYSSALNAKGMFPNIPMEIIDTRLALIAQGFVALEAARKAAAGGTLAEVAQAGRNLLPKIHVYWTMETLEYLRKGGRISLPKALLAGWLKVKPMMTFESGLVKPYDKPRTMAKAVERMLEIMKSRITDAPLHVGLAHADVPEAVQKLKETVMSRFKCQEILITDFTPVIGTHLGPGTLGIAFYNE